jgi:hypothetical protein
MSNENTILASVTYNGGVKYDGKIYLQDDEKSGGQVGGKPVSEQDLIVQQIKVNNYQKKLNNMDPNDNLYLGTERVLNNHKETLIKMQDEFDNRAVPALVPLPPLAAAAASTTDNLTGVMPPLPPPDANSQANSQIERVNTSSDNSSSEPGGKLPINKQLLLSALPTGTGTNARSKLFTAVSDMGKNAMTGNKILDYFKSDKKNVGQEQLLTNDTNPGQNLSNEQMTAAVQQGDASSLDLGSKINQTPNANVSSETRTDAVEGTAGQPQELDGPSNTSLAATDDTAIQPNRIILNANIRGRQFKGELTRKQTFTDRASNATRRAKNFVQQTLGIDVKSKKTQIRATLANEDPALSDVVQMVTNILNIKKQAPNDTDLSKIIEDAIAQIEGLAKDNNNDLTMQDRQKLDGLLNILNPSNTKGGKTRNKRMRPRRRVTYKYKYKSAPKSAPKSKSKLK